MLELILFCALCGVHSKPDAPKPKVADRQYFAALSVLAAAKIADELTTSEAISEGCREKNPILGPHPSDARLAGFAAATFAAEVGAAYLLKRYGQHHKWAHWLWIIEPSFQTANHTHAAIGNAQLTCLAKSRQYTIPPVVLIGPIR